MDPEINFGDFRRNKEQIITGPVKKNNDDNETDMSGRGREEYNPFDFG